MRVPLSLAARTPGRWSGIFLVGAALLVAPSALAAPAFASATANEIAYVTIGSNGDPGVVLQDLETRRATPLRPPSGVLFEGAEITSDGRRVVVAYERQSDDSSGIAVVDRDGTGFRALTRELSTATTLVFDAFPTVSPDSGTVLFTRLRVGGSNGQDVSSRLYTVPVAGGGATIVPTPSDALGGDFSPDGRQIVTELGPKIGDNGAVVRLSRDGSGTPVQLAARGTSPTWSPNGTTVAFAIQDQATPFFQRIATVRADAVGGVTTISAAPGVPQATRADNPTWLPDGRSLVFELVFGGADPGSLWAVDAAGTRGGRVAAQTTGFLPSVQGPPLANVSAGAPSAFTAVTPTRLLDTREGLGAPRARVAAGASIDLQVTGATTPEGTVPGNPTPPAPATGTATATSTATVPSGATAVVLNVTATNPTASTDVRVYPTGSGVPLASNLNTSAGRTVPNLVTVPLGTGGKVSLFNSGGSVDLVADIAGYYGAPGAGQAFTPVNPGRILDTRFRPIGAPAGQVARAGLVDLKVTGTLPTADGGSVTVPADASAVVLNVTGANVTGSTDVRVYPTPTDLSVPTVSNLNLRAGETAANLVTVRVGRDGTVRLRNNEASLDLIADIAGYYSPGSTSLFVPVTPLRLLDTRTGTGAAPIAVDAGGFVDLQVGGSRGVPTGATAAVLNITGTGVSASTDVRAYPAGTSSPPTVSNLNLLRGSTRANLSVVRLGSSGGVRIRNNAGSTQLIGDLAGYMVTRS